jgi:hypothetical protein
MSGEPFESDRLEGEGDDLVAVDTGERDHAEFDLLTELEMSGASAFRMRSSIRSAA